MPPASSSATDERALSRSAVAQSRLELAYVIRMFPQTSETFVANEILQLERLGVRIRIFSLLRPREGTIRHGCVRSIRAPVHYVDLGEEDAHACAARISAMVRGTPVQHLHAHFAHVATEVAWHAARLSGRPFSFTAHARDIYTADPDDLTRKIEAANFVVTCTRPNREYLAGLVDASQEQKLHLRYHGVDTAKFSPGPSRTRLDEPVILSVGRLVPKKGFPHLIQACRLLHDGGHRFRCVIVGEGPERTRLEGLIRRLRLQGVVHLAGARSQEELLDDYRSATVFALACEVQEDGDRDMMPNVLMEAMAVGLPVVSCPVGGIPDLLQPDENGILVEQADSAGLARVLGRLLADESMKQRLARSARSTVERGFAAAACTGELAGLFEAY